MPNADWGTFDIPLPSSMSSLQQPSMYAATTYQPSSAATYIPPPRMMSQSNDPTTLRPPLRTSIPNTTTGTGSSPMNALNDIDWVRIA
jgi:hypothetical protein